jgi:NAD(P)-dependent dehydrogenase (short-subunit alcohol dehydrogenase family)
MSIRQGVLVTGGGSGIGEGIVEVLADRGWRVAVNDLDADAAAQVAARVDGIAVPGDVARDPEAIVASAVEGLGGLQGLVNNAGIIRRGTLADADPDLLDEIYNVDLRAVILLSKAALPHLREVGGAIVNLSSIAAATPQMGALLYSAAKAGVSAFTSQAAVEWGPLGVRVNAIAPGMVRTAMAEAVYADAELHEKRRSMVPAGRIGRPDDIGKAAAFLLSDDADYITGQTLTVDGGFTRTLIDLLPHPSSH